VKNMSYDITYFIGNQTNVERGEVFRFDDFASMAEEFSKCAKGGKHSAYFIRGELYPLYRKDINLKSSKLLIIDGDSGIDGKDLCSPKEVHERIKELGYNHFIYSTHSHSSDVNKFRVVVESEEYEKKDIKLNIYKLMAEINEQCNIKLVTEMNTWSQPWFVPTRDNPEDGLFEHYKYLDGKAWEIDNEEDTGHSDNNNRKRYYGSDTYDEVHTQNGESRDEGTGQDLDTIYANIRTGREYHESCRTLSYQYLKDGMSRANTIARIRDLLNGTASDHIGSERWQQRYNDIERDVDGAIKRIAEEANVDFDMPEEEVILSDSGLPRPPGLLGELYDCAYRGLLYQYEEVALVSAIGVVAGIIGRKFNIVEPQPTGLNVFLTIVAGTGFGKESISTFVNRCIRNNSGGLKEHRSFIGPSNFTGPKAIVNAFQAARSRVCVISEAGLLMKVKSGNVEGKTAFILDAFSSSHKDGYTKESVYSSADDFVSEIRAMAITIISESTEEQLMDAYKSSGALASGYLPRQLIFKIDKRVSKINRNIDTTIPEKVGNRLGQLMELASKVQAEDDPDVIEVYFEDSCREDMLDYSDKYSGIAREFERTDMVKAVMATRIAQKAIRLAGICSIFNGEAEISEQSWSWAKDLCDYEFSKVSNALSGLAGSDDMDNAIRAVYGKMASIIDDSIGNKKCKIPYNYRQRKLINYGALKTACDKNNQVRTMSDNNNSNNYTSGLDKVLKHMEREGAVLILKRDPLGSKAPKLIQITESISFFMRSYGI
jgi:hypothetical protein